MPTQITLKLPTRAEPEWEEWCARLPAEATAGAALELALKIALEASVHMDGLGLMVNPQGPGRPGRDNGNWIMPRPDGGIEVMAGGHLMPRVAPGEPAPTEGEPIRSHPNSDDPE